MYIVSRRPHNPIKENRACMYPLYNDWFAIE